MSTVLDKRPRVASAGVLLALTAVAMTANATSFLLPTSNITNLLLFHRQSLATSAYMGDSWLPWILVAVVSVGPLAIWCGHAAAGQDHAVVSGRDI